MLHSVRERLAASLRRPLSLPSAPPFGSVDRLTYARNWLAYLSLTQTTLMGEEFPSADSTATATYPRDMCDRWDVDALPRGQAKEHSAQNGLWVIPGALSPQQCTDVINGMASLTRNGAVQGHCGVEVQPSVPPEPQDGEAAGVAQETWPWFEYERARWMVPLQPSPGVDPGFARILRTLQSHGCTDAHTWPRLGALAGPLGAALQLIEALPTLSIGAFARRKPLFLQVQALQRGAPITPHVDEPDVGGRAIATVLLQGPSEVRVGGVLFSLAAGDMYCLTGDARDRVDHEVFASAEDRLSVTIRYNSSGKS